MARRRKSIGRIFVLALVLLLVIWIGLSLVPVDRSNPPVTMEVSAAPEVMAVLERSCYDCHSNKTGWPWYSYIAPVSWLVAKDVREGREHVNFTEWDRYTPEQRAHHIEEAYEEAAEGHMPLPIYLRMHPDAALSQEDLLALRIWAESVERSGEEAD